MYVTYGIIEEDSTIIDVAVSEYKEDAVKRALELVKEQTEINPKKAKKAFEACTDVSGCGVTIGVTIAELLKHKVPNGTKIRGR